MKVKHLDDLYAWEQIRKLRDIDGFNPNNGFVPVAVCAPGGGRTFHYGGKDDWYGWYGKKTPFCAKRLWEEVRKELSRFERDALAYDVVEASECFNTIRFRDQTKARTYRDEFMRLLEQYANDGRMKSAVGRQPARPYPWDVAKRYEEVVIRDDDEYMPYTSYNQDIPPYSESAFPGWDAVKPFFVDLTEAELAFLAGGEIMNRKPVGMDAELVSACHRLDLPTVVRLLDSGANPNATSGGAYADNILDDTFMAVFDHEDRDEKLQVAFKIAEALLSHGCDIDFSPYEGHAPLCESIHYDVAITKFLLEHGADPNAICWIGIDDEPDTALDHLRDDISVYGKEPELMEMFEMLESRGGKYFSELVPDFFKV